jgi:hypothetical protein
MWRHGDVLIAPVKSIPDRAEERRGPVLAHGELTGHSHRLEDPTSGRILVRGGEMYLRVTAETARVVHPEHAPIALPRGEYRVWRQREYTPRSIRTVHD